MPTINRNVSNSDTTKTVAEDAAVPAKATKTADKRPVFEGVKNFVYIGPSLPGGQLISNTVLAGTYEEITDYYKEVIGLYPGVEKLFVPVNRLAESREKAKKSGNIVNKHFRDVAEKIKARGEKA